MVHSQKGSSVLNEMKEYINVFEVNSERAVSSEPAMTECAVPDEKRAGFFKMFGSGNNVFTHYFQDTSRVRVERLLRSSLSRLGVYKYVKRMIKG